MDRVVSLRLGGNLEIFCMPFAVACLSRRLAESNTVCVFNVYYDHFSSVLCE